MNLAGPSAPLFVQNQQLQHRMSYRDKTAIPIPISFPAALTRVAGKFFLIHLSVIIFQIHITCIVFLLYLQKKDMKKFILVVLSFSILLACQKEESFDYSYDASACLQTKSVSPFVFDWECVDWMPTPPMQSQISVPWTGQGSIVDFYGLDIVNDYKYSDGWRLLYSTFTPYATAPLVNPYFVLYNVYRGTLRIYLYITTSFVATSTYLQDGISIVYTAGTQTHLLNYLSGQVIDNSRRNPRFNQIQAKLNGVNAPLASNRWYMMEYELAYDPQLSVTPYSNLQLVWNLNYVNITNVLISGNSMATLQGTFGSTAPNYVEALQNGRMNAVTGIMSILGLDFLNSKYDPNTGSNTLGLSNSVFSALLSGITSAVGTISGGLPSIAYNILNAVFGGTNNSSGTPISLRYKSQLSLSGSCQESGSFPSMPISWWVPGTIGIGGAQGFIPLYDDPLGVFYWMGDQNITIHSVTRVSWQEDDVMGTGMYRNYNTSAVIGQRHYDDGLVINPSVLNIADVSIVEQDVLAWDVQTGEIVEEPFVAFHSENPYESAEIVMPTLAFAIRFGIKVQPKDGSPASYIYKTFKLKDNWVETTISE